MKHSKEFVERQTARGLYECPDCGGSGMNEERMLALMEQSNRTGEFVPPESAHCVKCNGLGWLRARVVRVVSGR